MIPNSDTMVPNSAPSSGGGGASGRTILTNTGDRFISATGSNSNDGLTLGTAWATLDHAMAIEATTLDLAGFGIINHVGAGSFAGFGLRQTVGGGAISFIGAGSGSCTIGEGINDGTYNAGECLSSYFPSTGTAFTFDGFKWTFVTESNYALIGLFSVGLAISFNALAGTSADHIFNLSTTTTDTAIYGSGRQSVSSSTGGAAGLTINYSPNATAVVAETFHFEQRTVGNFDPFITVNGNPVFSAGGPGAGGAAFFLLRDAEVNGNSSFIGAATGPMVYAVNGSKYAFVNSISGTSSGFADPSSELNVTNATTGDTHCVLGSMPTLSGLPATGDLPSNGMCAVFKDATGGGVYLAYNDNGTIKKVQLT